MSRRPYNEEEERAAYILGTPSPDRDREVALEKMRRRERSADEPETDAW